MNKALFTVALLLVGITGLIYLGSCNKVCPIPPMEQVCDVRGTYTGTFTNLQLWFDRSLYLQLKR